MAAPTVAELAALVPVSDEDKGILTSSRLIAPGEVQRRVLASTIRQEALLTEIRDLLAAQAAPSGRRAKAAAE